MEAASAERLVSEGTKEAVRKNADSIKRWITDGPLALRVLCFLACTASAAVACLQMLSSLLNPFSFIVSAYAAVFAIMGMVLEVKTLFCTRYCKARLDYWLRILSRVWGRGLFYLLVAGMQFTQKSLLGYACGAALLFCAVLSLAVSRAASKKLAALHNRLVAGFGDKSPGGVRAAFDRADSNKDDALDAVEFAQVASSLGTELTNDELEAVFGLLDSDRSGTISFQEFEAWWKGERGLTFYV